MRWFILHRIPRIFGGSELNLDKFVNSQLFLPDADEPEIKLENMKNFYKIYFILIFIAFLVLLYELLLYHSRSLLEYKKDIGSVSVTRYKINRRRVRRQFGVIGIMDHLKNKIFNPIVVV